MSSEAGKGAASFLRVFLPADFVPTLSVEVMVWLC